MKNKNKINSRIEIDDLATIKAINELQKESGHKTKPQLEWIIGQYFRNLEELKRLNNEVWKLRTS